MQEAFFGKHILITGGLGFIGSNLALRLCAAGGLVTIVDNLHPACGGNLFNVDSAQGALRIFDFDLCDRDALKKSRVFPNKYDFVFHLAGNVSHIASMENPIEDLQLNVISTLNLLEAVQLHSPQAKVVYAGTRQIYGRAASLPVHESHPIKPVDLNGIHKHAAEEYHRIFHEVYGLKTIVLRLTNTYGPRQLIRPSFQGVSGAFMGRALRNEPLLLFGGGQQKRDFCFVEDVVDAFLLAALTPACVGKVFNLSGEQVSLRTFAELIAIQIPQLDIQDVEFPAKLKGIDIGDFHGSSAAFHSATGWKPRTSLPAGIEKSLRYFQSFPERYL